MVAHREATLEALGRQYAAGHLHAGTLEHRVEVVLRARTLADLQDTTWDLPPLGWRARLAHLGRPARCTRMVFESPALLELALDAGPRTWSIGRSASCDVVLRDPAISRRHALLSVRGDRCTIRDTASMNGLEVNGVGTPAAVLRPGDRVRLGDAVTAHIR